MYVNQMDSPPTISKRCPRCSALDSPCDHRHHESASSVRLQCTCGRVVLFPEAASPSTADAEDFDSMMMVTHEPKSPRLDPALLPPLPQRCACGRSLSDGMDVDDEPAAGGDIEDLASEAAGGDIEDLASEAAGGEAAAATATASSGMAAAPAGGPTPKSPRSPRVSVGFVECPTCGRPTCPSLAPSVGYFSRAQVASHNAPGDMWLTANGVVYDVSRFLKRHPGGEASLLSRAGQDASRDYAFHSKQAQRQWERLAVGRVSACPFERQVGGGVLDGADAGRAGECVVT
jgi:hypothetical protein